MKKIILVLILTLGIIWTFSVFAHGVEEEAKGKAISEKLEAKEANCEDLTDDDFEALGEYFMGQMAGISHEAMNKMMEGTMGKKSEEEMHIVMGKRISGCDPKAQMPQNMMEGPMMGMMMSPGGMMGNMMDWNSLCLGTSWGWLGWIIMISFWILVIVAIFALIAWLINQLKLGAKSKSPLDILKERYAEGEISKEEFEEKKKDLI